jgi:putative transposase
MVPERIYHLTHRCHNRDFLLKFGRDRDLFSRMLREYSKRHKVSLLNYALTSNHVHILATGGSVEKIGVFMKQLAGEFGQGYNRRKKRSGSYWGDRYHSTMVEQGAYLWNCMLYIDMNMVRAGVVQEPCEWSWCGFRELIGQRKRNRLLDFARLLEETGFPDLETFRNAYQQAAADLVRNRACERQAHWTESIAVGSEAFVERIASTLYRRGRLDRIALDEGRNQWMLREARAEYGLGG